MKHRLSIKTRLIALALILGPVTLIAQPEHGGKPRSLLLKGILANPVIVNITPPDADSLAVQDYRDAMEEKAYRMGVVLPLSLSMENSGEWYQVNEGRIWKLHLRSSGAQALALYYDHFFLPPGSDLFIYSPGGEEIAGAFTSEINPKSGYFATRLIAGDEIILEYFQPEHSSGKADIHISGLRI